VKKPNQWMPVHIDDFLSRTQHLTTEEKGAYLMLLFNYWRNQEPLPDNDKQLSRIAGVSPDVWTEISEVIRPFFKASEGKLHQKRIDKEITKAVSISSKRQAAGKLGGSKSQANAKQELSKCLPSATANGVAQLNTRACKGQQTVGSQISRGWQPDESTLKIMEMNETEWAKDPACQAVRAKARKNAYRGVS